MKKIIFIITIILIVCSCDLSNTKEYQCNNKVIKPQIEKVKTICPKCKGIGKTKYSVGEIIGITIFSLGPGILCAGETRPCEVCKGLGYVEIPKIE